MNPNHISSAVHRFSTMADLPFSAESYSKLKFGSDSVAHQFGYELAEHVFKEHSEILLANECVVIPSPYNYVKNAATVMAQHFISHLNNLMVHANGSHVEWSIIHRKVSYTNDYGFLPKEKRRALIDNDEFYLNKGFIEGKVLLFIDDVKITGTHEDKLVQILEENALPNKALFLYYAEHDYQGHSADIEAQLNFAGIKTTNDYLKLAMQPNHHLIVRPIKFLLSLEESEFVHVMTQSQPLWREQLYFACLGEGYYKIPSYQPNFQILKRQVVDEHLLLPVAA